MPAVRTQKVNKNGICHFTSLMMTDPWKSIGLLQAAKYRKNVPESMRKTKKKFAKLRKFIIETKIC